jgi:phosphatidylserine/phosphatidylglycerophosphate/cardiolipin synthase-like enzyme
MFRAGAWRRVVQIVVVGSVLLGFGARAQAEELCDPSFEDCRTRLINLIRNESVGLDVAFWFMEDQRYMTEIIKRWQAGVPVRILADPRATTGGYPANGPILQAFVDARIPMRKRTASGILHWKMMLFAGQNVVQFSGANYSADAFDYAAPYSNYTDEAIYFCDDAEIVQSFMTKYDDLWLNTTTYANYANITTPLTRVYPVFTKHPDLNFPETENYANRATGRYNAENDRIDAIMYRITDERHTNAIIAAQARGVPVRLISDTHEYRNVARLWHSYNLDRLWAAGIPVRVRAHQGLNHQKSVILYGQAMTIFGSSNWTSASANQQQEHNYFTKKPWIFQWFVDQFERKWNNSNPLGAIETQPFVPLPPDKPVNKTPANNAVNQVTAGLKLKWYGGPWAHVYDIYFGLDPNPPLFAADVALGPSETTSQQQSFALPTLQPGTRYYWRIVSKTMAGKTAAGTTSSFLTAGTAPPPPEPVAGATTVNIWAADVQPASIFGLWQVLSDPTAAGGTALFMPDKGKATVSPALAAPANYFEVTFEAVAGVPYHLWARMRSYNNSLNNDSISIQFSDSLDGFGTPVYRIGSAHAAEMVLADGGSATVAGWGWADNGYGAFGPDIYFATSGTHTLRVQQREDGAVVDQIVLSPDTYVRAMPGAAKNDMAQFASTISGAAPAPTNIEAPWASTTVGIAGINGLARLDPASGVYSMYAGGGDIWAAADGMHFVYEPLTGDGSIVARVTAVGNTNARARAGVMFRESLAADSRNAFAFWSAGKATGFQRRLEPGAMTVATAGPAANVLAPYWLRLDRSGSVFTAYQSKDGVAWTFLGSDAVAMPETVLVGLAGTSMNQTATTLATIDNVAVIPGTPTAPVPPPGPPVLPAGWSRQDIGTIGYTGDSSYAASTFTVKGAGADIYGTADAFHFAYTTLAGDGAIVARVKSQQNTNTAAKAGVMIRNALTPDSTNALMALTPSKGSSFQRRLTDGATTLSTAGALVKAPYWVKLERVGGVITASESLDGVTWTVVGSEAMTTSAPVYVGLAVTSHLLTATSTAVFDNVVVTPY